MPLLVQEKKKKKKLLIFGGGVSRHLLCAVCSVPPIYFICARKKTKERHKTKWKCYDDQRSHFSSTDSRKQLISVRLDVRCCDIAMYTRGACVWLGKEQKQNLFTTLARMFRSVDLIFYGYSTSRIHYSNQMCGSKKKRKKYSV